MLAPGDYRRAVMLVAIAGCEIGLATLLFKFEHRDSAWVTLVYSINQLARASFLVVCAFIIIAWPRRDRVARYWTEAAQEQQLPLALSLNIAAFAAAMLAKLYLSSLDPDAVAAFWYWAYPATMLCAAISLALLIAPLNFWRRLVAEFPGEVLLSVAVGVLAATLAVASKESWTTLSSGTLALSYWLLRLYEADVVVDIDSATLGAGNFSVHIIASCSGYEGIALVATFLAVFLLAFRRHLRFPQALILFPIAIAASWLLNSVRIAALVSLGAHVSPQLALDGFHSWAGWIAFLGIAVSTMYGATRSRFLWRASDDDSTPAATRGDEALELLSPLIALLLSGIIAGAMRPFDQWAYAVKVAAVSAVLACFWRYYVRYLASPSVLAIGVGVFVGIVWQATEPGAAVPADLVQWFAALPPAWAVLWLAVRALGSVVLVPIAEELAFRGYLYRLLSRPSRLSPVVTTLSTLAVTSLAFGVLHERWLAATLAGLAYGLLVHRSGRLQDAIAAHMASNAVLLVVLTAQLTSLGSAISP